VTPARRRETLAAWCFLAPSALSFAAFVLVPVAASLALSFTRWDLVTPPAFVGFDNYVELLGWTREDGALRARDPEFWSSFGNTVFYMAAIPVQLTLALLLAVLLNERIYWRGFFRTMVFLPVVCTLVAVSLLWRWIFNPDYGLLNHALSRIGIEGPAWLVSRAFAKPAIMLVMIWKGLGYSTIIYLAGLQAVPEELHDVARLDGASAWTRFWRITFPLLAPTHLFLAIIGVIWGFQTFDTVFLMTGGGPAGSTTPVLLHLYQHAFKWFDMGYASAIAWVLFLFVLALTLLQWRIGGRSARTGEV